MGGLAPGSRAEVGSGLRCPCGARLGRGTKWTVLAVAPGPDGVLAQQLVAPITCGWPACESEAALRDGVVRGVVAAQALAGAPSYFTADEDSDLTRESMGEAWGLPRARLRVSGALGTAVGRQVAAELDRAAGEGREVDERGLAVLVDVSPDRIREVLYGEPSE